MSDSVAPPADEAEASALDVIQNGALSEFRGVYDPSLDFQKLALEAQYFARGFRLVDKEDLIAIPFAVIKVTYREGYLADKVQGDYVSLECVVADRATLDSPQIKHYMNRARPDKGANLVVYPNEPVVINDGGTGIRRTLTELFSDAGMIDVGGDKNDPRRFDRPYSLWKSGADEAQYGFEADKNGNAFRYIALRGLRVSEYESPYGPATTYYFA